MGQPSALEVAFAQQLRDVHLIDCVREYPFAVYAQRPVPKNPLRLDPDDMIPASPTGRHRREWKFDFAWPAQKIAVEVQGGIWKAGRHLQPSRIEGEYDKLNTAVALGWRVLVVSEKHIASGWALRWVEALLRHSPPQGA